MTNRRRARSLAALLAALASGAGAAAACGGGDKPPPAGVLGDGGSHADVVGHDGPAGDSGGGGDGTSPGPDAPHDGAPEADKDTYAPEDVTTEVIDLGPDGGALCNPAAAWGTATPVLTTGAADSTVFGGVTPDELTLVWASSTGGTVTAWYADRASTSAAFGTPQALATSFGALALDRVTVSGDGLRIGAVASDHLSFVGAKRAARSGAFDTVDHEFDALGGGEIPPALGTLLLAGDDSELLYLITGQSSDYVIHEANNGLPSWKGGVELAVAALARSGTQLRRPSGLSLDALALFYWDEVSGSEKIATRPVLAQPFNQFVDIGSRANASPTASCQRIYYATPASGGAITIVYADAPPPPATDP